MHTMQSLPGFSDLVGLAYQGVEEAKPWKGLMRRLTEVTGAHDSSLLISSPAAPGAYYLITDNEDPAAVGRQRVDDVMTVNWYQELPIPRASNIEELIPLDQFLTSPLYQRFLKPLRIRHLMGMDVLRNDVMRVKLSLERTDDQGVFGDDSKQLVELLVPHLQRAIRLREQYTHGSYIQEFFEEAMARMSIACLLLDGYGRVVSANQAARELTETSEFLHLQNGKLRCADSIDSRPLTEAIELALAAHRNKTRSQRGQGVCLEASPGNPVLDVVVKPLVSDRVLDSWEKPAAVVYVNASLQASIDLDPVMLRSMYGFTKCESKLAALLARGLSISESAEALGVSVNTVKTHLRGIYERMGTSKQAQVVARLNHSTARLL